MRKISTFTALMLALLVIFSNVTLAVTIDTDVEFEVGNETYTVQSAMDFSSIAISSSHVIFNNTGSYVTSDNDIDIELIYINDDITDANDGDLVLEFYADTTSGNVLLDISGFPAGRNYIVKRDGITIATSTANSSGYISFINDIWSEHLFEIFHVGVDDVSTEKWAFKIRDYAPSEYWGEDGANNGSFRSRAVPVAANIDDDPQLEVFISSGYSTTAASRWGVVVCVDGDTGAEQWNYSAEELGCHICMELGDLDGDGNLELLVCGFSKILALHAENGTVLWGPYTTEHHEGSRLDHAAIIATIDGTVFVYHCSGTFEGTYKRWGINGTVHTWADLGQVYPCNGGLSAADINQDGVLDILQPGRYQGYNGKMYYRGLQCLDEDLNIQWNQTNAQSSGGNPIIYDVNGDGYLDVTVVAGGVMVMDGSTMAPMIGKFDTSISGVSGHDGCPIYDVDGDGDLEMFITRETSTAVTIWDLTNWQLEATLNFDSTGVYQTPIIANVHGDSGMEIIYSASDGVYIWNSTATDTYNLISMDKHGWDPYQNCFHTWLVDDVDNDGLNEIIAPGRRNTCGGWVMCFDTEGATLGADIDNTYYSERRNLVEKYIPPISGSSEVNNPPVFSGCTPSDGATGVSISTSSLSITIEDPEGDSFDWTIQCSNGQSSEGYGEPPYYTPSLSSSGHFELKWSKSTTEIGVASNANAIIQDIDDDGIQEIFLGGKTNFTVGETDPELRLACLNATTGETIWNVTYDSGYASSGNNYFWPMVYDFNKDGEYEVIVDSGAGPTVMRNATSGAEIWNKSDVRTGWHQQAYVDFGNEVFLYLVGGPGSSTFIKKVNGSTGAIVDSTSQIYECWGGPAIADLDGDGHYELFTTDRAITGRGLRCFNMTDLSLKWGRDDILCSSQSPYIADFDEDGELEVMVVDQGSPPHCYIFNSTGFEEHESTESLYHHHQACVGNVDDDDHLELICGDGTSPKIYDLYTHEAVTPGWEIVANVGEIYDVIPDENNINEILHTGDQVGGETASIWRYNVTSEAYEELHSFGHRVMWSVAADVDFDGYKEIVMGWHSNWFVGSSYVWCYETNAPADWPAPLTNIGFGGTRRLNNDEFIEPPGEYEMIDYGENNGTKSLTLSGLDYSTTYTWFVNATDGNSWTRESYSFTTIHESSEITSPVVITDSPTNITDTTATLWGDLVDNGGEDCSVWFEYDNYEEECTGLVATGTCVKDGRSIFWKSRHSSSSNNKPDWQSGLNYNYWSVSGYLGMNEVGLAMGNFVCYDLIDVENRDYAHTEIQGDGVNGMSSAIRTALGRYDTVGKAARFMAINCTYSGNYQVGIVSSEPGVGAVVSMMNYSGNIYSHITWVNNTWAHLANVHYCDWVTSGWAANDPNDNNDETIYDMCTDITTNGGINGDYLIDWQEICQRGGKNVSGKEKGTDTFSCNGKIAKGSATVAMVVVSGNSSYDGAANVAFSAFGRQPLVGIFLPLGASYLTSDADIPSNFTSGGGIEDYVDVKSIYATTTGVVHGNTFYCDRVREVLEYANYNENISFDAYDMFMNNLMTAADTAEVKSRLETFADENMSITLNGYINNLTEPGPDKIYPHSSGPFSETITDLTPGTVYYVKAYANNSEYSASGSQVIFLTRPCEPTNVQVIAEGQNQIDLSWTKGIGADNTIIERNSLASWPRGEGTEIYNGIGSSYQDIGLSAGTHYYYQLWSFTSAEGEHQYSSSYSSGDTITQFGLEPNIEFVPPTPENNSQISNTYVNINVSVADESDTSSFIDWNYSLVGYWNFEHTDSTSVHDSSAYGNHGTFSGDGFGESSLTTGKYGDALGFDGSDDYIDLPKDDMTAGQSEVTLEFWINADEWISTNTLWDEYHSDVYWQNSIRCDKWYTRDSSTGLTGSRDNDLSLPTLTPGEWHHLVFVYSVSQNTKAIYLDGELYTSTSISIDPLTSKRQGARLGYACDGTNFDGIIDEVRVWKRALSLEEISASYNSKINQLYHNFTGLSDGIYSYYAHAIDTAGNENTTEMRNIEITPLTLDVTYSGSGFGTVNIDPAGPYHYGDVVELEAIPNTGSYFAGWNGDLSGTTNPEHLTITDHMNVNAEFILSDYTLSIVTSGDGSGTVDVDPDGPYHYDDIVTLTANPTDGSIFAGWNGDLTGNDNPVDVTITGNMVVTAVFTQDEYTLTVTTSGSGSGTLDVIPSGPYHYGDTITIEAIPDTGSHFVEWSDDLIGSDNPITFQIYDNMNIDAKFDLDSYTIIVNTIGSGTVIKDPDQATYVYGDVVDLEAVADVGWSFSHWSGDLTGNSNPDTLEITGDMSVTAVFTQNQYTLTVTIDGSGSVDIDLAGPYVYGDIVELEAIADTGWAFSHWTGDIDGSTNPKSIIIDDNKEITAHFTQKTYTLTVTVNGDGDVVKDPDQASYVYGDVVELEAVADPGWSFASWSGDLVSVVNPDTVTMDGDKIVTCTFTEDEYTLTVNVVGSGSVLKDPDQATYTYGTSVELITVADIGWTFSHWSGDLTGSNNPETLEITNDMSVTTVFTQNQYTLTVIIAGDGSGAVDVSPTAPYVYGDIVTLTANPADGSTFAGWGGDLTGNDNPTDITITGNMMVTAVFTENQYTLTVITVGDGIVDVSPAGPYNYEDTVDLIAIPYVGWSFSHWSGDLVGSDNSDTLEITGNMVVTAHFTKTYDLTMAVDPVLGGTTTPAVGTDTYDEGTVVNIDANANNGWVFDHWDGDVDDPSTQESNHVTMDEDQTVTAVFLELFTLDVTTIGSGTVALDPPGGTYADGAPVQLTATADSGWTFDHWSGPNASELVDNDDGSWSITMNGDKTVTAHFTQNAYTLTVDVDGNGVVVKDPDQATYVHGASVELGAVADVGWAFSYWSGDLDGSVNPESIVMDGDKVVTAHFTQTVPPDNGPVFSDMSIGNGTTGVSIGTSSLSITIEDPDGDTFNWTIETSPKIGSSFGIGEGNGSKSCSISGLDYSTTYTWFVNATDGNSWTNKTYTFTTETAPKDPPYNPPGDPPQNDPPTADAGGPYEGYAGVELTFNGSGSTDDGTITSYEWDFGDETTGTGVSSTHTYTDTGNYNVTLTVTDNGGKIDSNTTYVVITEKTNHVPEKPTVNGDETGNKNIEYTYTAVSTDPDNDTIRYTFEWGDGTNTTTEFLQNGTTTTQNHTWTAAGIYVIKVFAIDENNATSETEKLIMLIDAHYIQDIGYLLDNNGDGTYDSFHNEASGQETDVGQDGRKYLIDSDGDGEWDHEYDSETKTLSGCGQEQKEEEKQISLPLYLGFVTIVFAIIILACLAVFFRGEFKLFLSKHRKRRIFLYGKEKETEGQSIGEKISVQCPQCKYVSTIEKGEGITRVGCPECGTKGWAR